ncbi:MAG: FAD-binding protein, partial [Armatimonadota bacterium]
MYKDMIIPDFSGELNTDVQMSGYTTWHVGGPAEYMVEPKSIDDISAVFNFAATEGLPITIIGYGSNILVSDSGIPGITVCLKRYFRKTEIDRESGLISAEAGCSLPSLSHLAELNGISGFEFLVGIPGTVGGGMVMNAGMGGPDGPSIRDILVRATLLDCDTGEICVKKQSELDMRYRHTSISSGKLWALKG